MDAVQQAQPPEQLKTLLLALLPDDHTTVGNITLLAQLQASALGAGLKPIGEDDFKAARDALVANGQAVKGKGRGGSLARATGAERYQGMAIRIDDVSLTSLVGWQPNGNMTITDGSLTLPIKLGRGTGFTTFAPPTGTFSIVGILDQEDAIATDGFKDGYYLYLMDYDGTHFYLPGLNLAPADFDQDGDVDSDDFAHLQACYTENGTTATPDCRDADLTRDLYVSSQDLDLFEKCHSGPAVPADPDCLSAA